MHLCKECSVSFEHTRTFKLHLKRVHDLTLKEYVIKHEHGGVHPVCACGCEKHVKWRNDAYFMTLVRGHYTQELRDNQSQRRKGKKTSEKTKALQKQVALEFWSTNDGKAKAKERGRKLTEFHASSAGETWSQDQSRRLKEFNATEKGKQIRVDVGAKVKQWRVEHPESMIEMGGKIRAWYASEAGAKFLSERSVKMTAFYASPEGQDLIKQIVDKLKVKNRLSQEEFEKRLALTFIKLEPLQELPTYAEYVGWRETFTIPIILRCRECKHEHVRMLVNVINVPKCPNCDGLVTKPQLEIAKFVQSLGFDINISTRVIIAPKEIDVWVPSARFGIEFNGLYWHSKLNRPDDNHVVDKHALAYQKGIRLMTLFEDEWRDKNFIVRSMIKNRLGLSPNKFQARKLVVKELGVIERRTFFEQNHVDGDVRAHAAYGLFADGSVVAAMSLRRPFHASLKNKWEIARFSTLCDSVVIGGLSRLVSHVKGNFPELMTYVDMRFGLGEGYVKAGFKRVRETSPRFWWTDFVNRYDRFVIRSKDGTSQSEIASNLGLSKIFGAQNIVFEI